MSATTLFTNANVFDGKNEKLIEKANVLVDGNKVKMISTEKIEAGDATVIRITSYNVCYTKLLRIVFPDGDIFKAGVGGQGLYISPARDAVVVYFSTGKQQEEILARAITQSL